MITLTLAADDRRLKDRCDDLMSAFRRLRKTDGWQRRVRGGVYAIETTRGATGGHWHVHLHVLADGTFFPHGELRELWKQASGGSTIVDIRPAHDRRSQARYVSRYVAKPDGLAEWHPSVICEYADAMHGRRMLHTFGTLHGVSLDHNDDAPVPLDSVRRVPLRELERSADDGCPIAAWIVDTLRRLSRPLNRALSRTHGGLPPPALPPPEPGDVAVLSELISSWGDSRLDHRSIADRVAYLRDVCRTARDRRVAAARDATLALW